MNKILPLLIVLIAVGGSGFLAMTLRTGGGAADQGSDGATGEIYAVEEDEKVKDTDFFKFQRDFVVPVMQGPHVDALILLSLNIEMTPEGIEEIRPKEPKLRDAFMRTLLSMSHEGIFDRDITDPVVYDAIQKRLLETAKNMTGEASYSVLIVDFARQRQ